MNSGNQLRWAKRLADMIIGSDGQCINFILLLYFRRQKYNTELLICFSYSAAHLKAIYARNHYIQ
ncbi:hypothetical protein D3C76_1557820 [compost metagenome]